MCDRIQLLNRVGNALGIQSRGHKRVIAITAVHQVVAGAPDQKVIAAVAVQEVIAARTH